jgi:hypothetical protein
MDTLFAALVFVARHDLIAFRITCIQTMHGSNVEPGAEMA